MTVATEKVRHRTMCATALGMVALMLLVVAVPLVKPLEIAPSAVARSTYYTPANGEEA